MNGQYYSESATVLTCGETTGRSLGLGGAIFHDFNGTLCDTRKHAMPRRHQVRCETGSQGGVELFNGGRLVQSRRGPMSDLPAAKDGRSVGSAGKGHVGNGVLRRGVHGIVRLFQGARSESALDSQKLEVGAATLGVNFHDFWTGSDVTDTLDEFDHAAIRRGETHGGQFRRHCDIQRVKIITIGPRSFRSRWVGSQIHANRPMHPSRL
jgi:hypothetical protein